MQKCPIAKSSKFDWKAVKFGGLTMEQQPCLIPTSNHKFKRLKVKIA